MIFGILGQVQANTAGRVVIMTRGGVAYGLLASLSCQAQCSVGTEVSIETYLVVKEDALDLYGFSSVDEKNLFELLISVSGVGPKTALNILALGVVTDIAGAIGRGDVVYLTKVSGIGKKTAERLVVELRSKLELQAGRLASSPLGTSTVMPDVIAGLEALGYAPLQARDIVQQLDTRDKTSEQLLREALRLLGS